MNTTNNTSDYSDSSYDEIFHEDCFDRNNVMRQLLLDMKNKPQVIIPKSITPVTYDEDGYDHYGYDQYGYNKYD